VADDKAIYWGTGKRKTSVARVRLLPGTGTVTVNGRPVDAYFGRQTDRVQAIASLAAVGLADRFDVIARIHGGGVTGQAGALRHGIARALVEADPNLRGDLKRAGFLSRDAREVERKKAGFKKARRRPQFSKR
jgi:small subunit ribosomal protein S9